MTARTVLRDYQEQALAAVLAPPPGVNRQLLEMATGAGKTVTFAALLHRVLTPGQRGLVLAHREELLEQAAAKIAAIDPDLHVELERGVAVARLEASLFSADARKIVVASIQTLHAARLKHWPRDAFAYVICDEAHHGIASAYQRIFEHFGCMEGRTPLLGVTATPMRTIRTERLESVFQRTAASVGIVDLVARGHLVPIRVRRIASAADLREVKSVAGDFKRSYRISGTFGNRPEAGSIKKTA